MNTVKIAIDLSGWDGPVPPSSFTESSDSIGLCVAKRVFEQVDDTGDFALTATSTQNGQEQKRFKCHTIYLQAASPFFAKLVTGTWKEAEEKVGELRFPPEVVELIRDSLYGGTLSKLEDNVGLALETLEAAHMTQFTLLEKAVKTLILGKDTEWMEIEEALTLFAKAEQWGDEELKMKAMEIMIS